MKVKHFPVMMAKRLQRIHQKEGEMQIVQCLFFVHQEDTSTINEQEIINLAIITPLPSACYTKNKIRIFEKMNMDMDGQKK